jgi:prevent-host-death family protein
MRPVQIAELKNRLSAYLNRVRAGEEIVIRDRNTPIAKIVPLPADLDEDERSLVAAGLLRLPSKPWNPEAFFAIGKGVRTGKTTNAAMDRALAWAREDLDAGILGRKRRPAAVRSRASK